MSTIKTPIICFPGGGGGNWLSNLIWHLENENFELPKVNVVFDGQPLCSLPITHAFDISKHDILNKNYILFSNKFLFNHYLNLAFKARYYIDKIETKSFQYQLFNLTNAARHCLADVQYYKKYCENIDLDSRLIFQDPGQFIDRLFEILNSLNIIYSPNRDYVYQSIKYYQSTCLNPDEHFANLKSIFWLGCCHAIALIDKLQLDVINSDITLESAADLLEPLTNYCSDRVWPLMFEWKK
jgi:hypothetical protein